MNIAKALAHLNKYTDKNRAYYALLEIMIIAWALYAFHLLDFSQLDWLTPHISNLIGSAIIVLILIGPTAFQLPKLHIKRICIAAVVMVAVNLILELVNPIKSINAPILYWANFNTGDYVDAVYGVVGVLIVLTSLALPDRVKSKQE